MFNIHASKIYFASSAKDYTTITDSKNFTKCCSHVIQIMCDQNFLPSKYNKQIFTLTFKSFKTFKDLLTPT